MPEQDPLESLILDADEVDRSRIANSLRRYVGVDRKSGRVHLLPDFNRLKSKQKLVAYLLGIKVAHLLSLTDDEAVPNRDIPAATGMPMGTIAPMLKQLRENRLVSQTDDGHYYLSPTQINTAIDLLDE